MLRTVLAVLAGAGLLSCREVPTALVEQERPAQFSTTSAPEIVVSQVYGGGGNSGATYTHDFVELFNPGPVAVSVSGWSVQYASATGSSWNVTALSGTIAPGGYFLVRQAAGAGGTTALPTPDAIGNANMAAGAGKVALARHASALTGTCPTTEVVDRVGYGGSNCDVAWAPNAPTLSNTTAAIRKDHGCAYTGDPSADFFAAAPTPRNSASPAHHCGDAPPPTEAVAVDVAPLTATLMVGETATFSATARDEDGNPVSTTFTWSSGDQAVATIAANGTATGLAAGTTTIIAKAANGVEGEATITVTAPPPPPPPADIVISQVYGGGGNAGAVYTHDFIELFNRGDTPVNLDGWRVYYASAAGTGFTNFTPLSGVIQPKQYYLVQAAQGNAGTTPLPAPDAIGTLAMGGTAGKVILTNAAAPSGACPVGPAVVDRVGYGANTTENGCAEVWGGRTADLSNTTAAFRKNDGCVNTGNAANDFTVMAPHPRNSATPAKNCTQPARPRSSATILINELMGDPANAESASWGQWFEVHNHGTVPVDLQGWTIVSDGTLQPNHVIAQSVVIPAGGFAVLGRGADADRNGGIDLNYNYFVGTGTTIWLDASDLLMLLDPAGAVADSVAWSSLPRGVTKGLIDPLAPAADVDGPSWGYSTTTFGAGDYGTPGAANTGLAAVPPFVSPNRVNTFGRTADVPIPVGFEAQVFADLRSPTNQVIPSTFTWTSQTPALVSVDERGVVRGLAPGNAVIRATAEDGAFRHHSLVIEVALPSTTADYRNHTEFGIPTDGNPADDFPVLRQQFTASWNGPRGIPNWVAYNLNGTHIVPGQDRCNCFTFDPIVEAGGFSRYNTADYTGVGGSTPFHGYAIDRGHLARSFDRTSGTFDNAVTYYFSNIVPQAADLNQGPWSGFEFYLGDIARFEDKEVYIYTGVDRGSKGTIKNEGKIDIPAYNWKVAVVMERGKGVNDVRTVRDLQVVAVVMPNVPGIRNEAWQSYLVTVDSVESLSGYDLLSALSPGMQRVLQAELDAALLALIRAVDMYVVEGTLRPEQAQSLLAKLRTAEDRLVHGHLTPAANQIGAFVLEVEAMVKSRRLTAVQAEALVTPARALIQALQAS